MFQLDHGSIRRYEIDRGRPTNLEGTAHASSNFRALGYSNECLRMTARPVWFAILHCRTFI
jgi:hypothetical protein